MAVNEKDFTFIWNIKNYSFSFYEKIIYSPSFFVPIIEPTKEDEIASVGTEWLLIVDCYKGKDNICCRIQRKNVPGPDELKLDYELSFLAGDGSVLRSEIFTEKGYKKGDVDCHSDLRAEKDEILTRNKDLFIPNDTFAIRCRMWNSKELILKAGRCFSETIIETECRSYVGIIERFSKTKPNSKTLVCIKPSPIKNFFSFMNFCVTADGKLDIEIKPLDYGHKYKYDCKIFIQDVSGNKIKCGQGEFYDTKLQCISLTLPMEHLQENKGYYLPNDILTLECEVVFPTGNFIEKVDEEILSDDDSDDDDNDDGSDDDDGDRNDNEDKSINSLYVQVTFPTDNLIEKLKYKCEESEKMLSTKIKNFIFKETYTGHFSTLKDDLVSMFNKKILCDLEIKTDTEIFAAHKIVLSARSPVFNSMFTSDMKEKKDSCVYFPDLDAETVRRMLLFIYSDTVDDLEYESAKNLYYVADKYNIVSLNRWCSNFLKQTLKHSNCCEVLLLADKHHDQDLKTFLQDYIEKEAKAVLLSVDWMNLQKEHPRLTTEVLHALYLKKRRA